MLLAALLSMDERALRPLRLAWLDAYQALAPRAVHSQPALVVDIDEASLKTLGQWPWPRSLVARLVSRIAEGGPAAIGIDLLMPEPDRLSPERLPALVPGMDPDTAARLRGLERNDAALAGALRGRPVVLGVAGLESGPATALPQASLRTFGGDPMPFLRAFPVVLRSVDEIHGAAAGHGLISVDTETGVVRRVPLVAAVAGAVVPALGLEMLRVASGAPALLVRVGGQGIEAVGAGDLWIPTQPDGSVWIHYSPHSRDRFVSAADLLDGRVDPRQLFERKLVILGITALAASDYHATPVSADRMPGPEIHAQLLENIFDGGLLARPRWVRWAEAAALAAGGLALVLILPVRSPRLSGMVLGAMVAGLVGGGWVLYLGARVLFDAASPSVGLAVLFTAMLGVTLAEADGQRRALRAQVERQREEAARVAGELEAARRIQMGILPAADVALAGESRVGVYAFLEPAREVGGDLYDFFRLDADRVFFLIGDVAGKGLPGCLFMAVSKALCKSAALRRSGDVAAMLREANGEISRDNAEGLFVTAFAGILDARTGIIEYCNAGHEPAWIVGGPGALGRLAEGGGPPLCVLDDFPYTAASRRLAPGEAVCLVTDGVTEALDAGEAFYGRERLEAVIAGVGSTEARAVGEALRADVGRFGAGVEPADDLAILVLRWNGPGERILSGC